MRRRDFITTLGGAALAWPTCTLAETPSPVIGFLNAFAQSPATLPPEQFLQGLREAGYVEGRNVALASRGANGNSDQLRSLANELVGLDVAVIAAFGLPAALAAKSATAKLPIVFWTSGDPVADGLVANLQPSGRQSDWRCLP